MIAYRDNSSTAQSSGTTLTLTAPEDVEIGDLLLAAVQVAGGTGITITPPSGWDLVLRTDQTTTQSLAVYRHRYTAESEASWGWTLTSAAAVGVLVALGGVDHVSPVDVSGGQANASSTSAVAPSVTTTRTNAQLVALFAAATGAVAATPPSGMTERVDTAGAALALSVAEARQGTLGASGTKTATLSSAAANIGMLVALCPSALNTPSEARDEGNWSYAGWQNRFTTEAQMSAFVERMLQRANTELRQAVGRDFYTGQVLQEPWLALFAEAEMAYAQACLLRAAEAIARTGDDNAPAPFFGSTREIAQAGATMLAVYERLVRRAQIAAGRGKPVFRAVLTTGSVMEPIDPTAGSDADPFDDTIEGG
jgi:hypothetical protein